MYAIDILLIGYLIGCISPAALIAKIKHVDLKKEGTKNLGATNTALVFGKAAGLFVMLFDIMKSVLAAEVTCILFPQISYAGMLASIGCILGHCFPVFMHFRGGKGLAAFGGMVWAYNPSFFIMIVIPGVLLMAILNTGVAVPMMACVMFPILVAVYGNNSVETILAILASVIIAIMHLGNLKRALERKDIISVRNFFGKMFSKQEKAK